MRCKTEVGDGSGGQVEKLLAEVGAAEAEARSPRVGPSAGLDARSRMLERLASEISRLSFHVARGKVVPSPPGPPASSSCPPSHRR